MWYFFIFIYFYFILMSFEKNVYSRFFVPCSCLLISCAIYHVTQSNSTLSMLVLLRITSDCTAVALPVQMILRVLLLLV